MPKIKGIPFVRCSFIVRVSSPPFTMTLFPLGICLRNALVESFCCAVRPLKNTESRSLAPFVVGGLGALVEAAVRADKVVSFV
jgi:sulfur relay (sulfurtransferase) complex TusBCD TusD component (DsrE family)